jgi:hypothetical protein
MESGKTKQRANRLVNEGEQQACDHGVGKRYSPQPFCRSISRPCEVIRKVSHTQILPTKPSPNVVIHSTRLGVVRTSRDRTPLSGFPAQSSIISVAAGVAGAASFATPSNRGASRSSYFAGTMRCTERWRRNSSISRSRAINEDSRVGNPVLAASSHRASSYRSGDKCGAT